MHTSWTHHCPKLFSSLELLLMHSGSAPALSPTTALSALFMHLCACMHLHKETGGTGEVVAASMPGGAGRTEEWEAGEGQEGKKREVEVADVMGSARASSRRREAEGGCAGCRSLGYQL